MPRFYAETTNAAAKTHRRRLLSQQELFDDGKIIAPVTQVSAKGLSASIDDFDRQGFGLNDMLVAIGPEIGND
jgi:hypothetical protein